MKTIIYLDQNYVSDLTKTRTGHPRVTSCYRDLYTSLGEAVLGNSAVCPISPFHIEEAEFDSRLAMAQYDTMRQLSRGIEFLFWGEVLHQQVIAAFQRYVRNEDSNARLGWKQAFNTNPQARPRAGAQSIDGPRIDAFVARGRWIKKLYETQGEAALPGGRSDQKRTEAYGFIHNVYVRPWENLLTGKVDIFSRAGLNYLGRLSEAHVQLTGQKMRWPPVEVLQFLCSHHMLNVPFIDIYSSLRAAMAGDKNRKPKGSDLQDVLIAAAVLPYVDIFGTDGHLKQLIVELKLDARYKARVLGSRKSDVLALAALIQDRVLVGA